MPLRGARTHRVERADGGRKTNVRRAPDEEDVLGPRQYQPHDVGEDGDVCGLEDGAVPVGICDQRIPDVIAPHFDCIQGAGWRDSARVREKGFHLRGEVDVQPVLVRPRRTHRVVGAFAGTPVCRPDTAREAT